MCLNPIWSVIWKDKENKNRVQIFSSQFKAERLLNEFSCNARVVPLACGKCEQCSKSRALEWSYRLYHEAQDYKKTCFITLTYKDDPKFLFKKDFQNFMKRLRKAIPEKIKFFGCGEYGSKRSRPHYHAVIFGWCPDDLKYVCTDKNGFKIFSSQFLSNVWNLGLISVGYCSMESFKYVCNYMQKQNKYKWHVDPLFDEAPPFVLMSKKLGLNWFLKHYNTLETDKIYYKDSVHSLPRYYLKVADKLQYDLTLLKERRIIKAENQAFVRGSNNLGTVYEKV